MRESILITIVIFLWICLCLALKEINTIKHDIVYGKVTVRENVFSCKKWEYTKEKQK